MVTFWVLGSHPQVFGLLMLADVSEVCSAVFLVWCIQYLTPAPTLAPTLALTLPFPLTLISSFPTVAKTCVHSRFSFSHTLTEQVDDWVGLT